MKKQRFIILSIAILLMNIAMSLSAQNTVDDDIQTTLDKLSQQFISASEYTSFISTIDDVTENIHQVYLTESDTPTLSYTSSNQLIKRTIAYDDEGNATAQILSDYEIVEGLDDLTTAYLVTTDVRYIDHVYYYHIRTDDEDLQQALELTNEWEILTPEDIDNLPIADITNPFSQENTLYLLEIASQSSRMTIGSATIDDETFDTISFGFNGAEFVEISSQFNQLGLSIDGIDEANSTEELIADLSQQTDQDMIIISFFINQDELLAGFSFEYYLTINTTGEAVDLDYIDDIHFETNFFRREILSQINQPIPNIETPLLPETTETPS